jgi:hypothetical protein
VSIQHHASSILIPILLSGVKFQFHGSVSSVGNKYVSHFGNTTPTVTNSLGVQVVVSPFSTIIYILFISITVADAFDLRGCVVHNIRYMLPLTVTHHRYTSIINHLFPKFNGTGIIALRTQQHLLLIIISPNSCTPSTKFVRISNQVYLTSINTSLFTAAST